MYAHQNAAFSVAPLMRYTNRYFRSLLRTISKHALLYTEMLTPGSILHSDPKRFLEFLPMENPLVLQLGGSDPMQMAKAAAIAKDYGYKEININVGCPSNKVQSGNFGACQMTNPKQVSEIFCAISEYTQLPVSVKTRVGIDQHEDYEFLQTFIQTLSSAGCQRFIIHARNAILNGLSPKQNQKVPPLKYDFVFRLKEDFPRSIIELNGGLRDLTLAKKFLNRVDGVMLGRAVIDNPWILKDVDAMFFNALSPQKSQVDVVKEMLPFIDSWQLSGTHPSLLLHPFLLLFKGVRGGKKYRRFLSEKQNGSMAKKIETALQYVQEP